MLELSNDFLARTPKAQEIIANARIMKAYQNQLAETDYQIIKCYEYSLVGLELPYDVEALHATREYLREEIRKLEEKMS
jgi:hypothetical protein